MPNDGRVDPKLPEESEPTAAQVVLEVVELLAAREARHAEGEPRLFWERTLHHCVRMGFTVESAATAADDALRLWHKRFSE